MSAPRTYVIQTLGCQMNVHDSERIAGSLDAAGYVPARDGIDPDLVVFNTCAVRENADNKLYGHLSFLAPTKKERPSMQIAIGGCLAQKDQGEILKRAPYVDVVFGTHNVGSLPTLLERARIEEEAQIEILEGLEHFPSTLPSRRHSAFSAWVSISVGCNNTCTFCIVPQLRGREKDRPAEEILREVRALAEQGVNEITLLGQNVNAYGVDFGDRAAFAKLLRECGRVDGIDRIRFMSPHPRDFTDDVIAAMAETPKVMPHLHMPLQSGSNDILQAMRRSYRSDRYLGIIEKVRAAMPDSSITTDIIVGFPGETEKDFQETISVYRQAKFMTAYTFQYSKRPGTPAATMPDQVPPDIVAERYNRLMELQREVSQAVNNELLGKSVEVLVSDESGDKQLSGKSRDFRLVHFPASPEIRLGDLVTVTIDQAKPFYIASSQPHLTHIKTRGGDAHAERVKESATNGVMLGIPSLPKYSF